MRRLATFALLAALVASTALSGCASKAPPPPDASVTSSAAMPAAAMQANAMPTGAMASDMMPSATMPTCGAGDPVVWVNTKSKVFHSSTDPLFGKTKRGGYMCSAAALAAGNRAAKPGAPTSPRHRRATPAPEAT